MSDILEINQTAGALARSRLVAYWELTKPRIAGMVLIATALGFLLALQAKPTSAEMVLLIHAVVGTALVACGANALNQYLEAEHDARMQRTFERPVPSGRLSASEVLSFSLLLLVAGVVYLAVQTNLLAALLAGISWLSYGFVYTPLKRKTSFCVHIGAIPGALPPVIGWAACTGSLSPNAAILFAILFFWQLPHFAAIAWLYREDYGHAGFKILSVLDPRGTKTSRHMIVYTIVLIAVSLLPMTHGSSGVTYGIGATLLGLGFLAFGLRFVFNRTKAVARQVLLASIIYLPCLLALMVIDKAYFT